MGQAETWSGAFGRSYTDRNDLGVEAIEQRYQEQFGIGRRALNEDFLGELPRELSILEVGCNVGNQLAFLAEMGFRRLFGVELQGYALARARERLPGAGLARASALALPFGDGDFDLVFTSGVLIHIHPGELPRVLDEIHRVAGGWIWGLEYFARAPTEVPYRGQRDLLWKAPFADHYQQRFPELARVRERWLPYKGQSGNVDSMYLFRKPGSG
jgi:pseudaminic acid biosynthesis-associated methylase